MNIRPADRIKKDLMGWSRSSGYDIIIPNFYLGHYEMDLFRLTPAGLITEYEIKTSRSDYKADFNKELPGCEGKHALMTGKKCICNRFYFVVPKKIIRADEVPDYAGLLYYKGNRGFEVIKNAPLIHKEKQPLTIYKDLAVSLSFREQVLRDRIAQLRKRLGKKSG
jgi:hypothetical protein